jgi:hypothetical protein
MDSVMCVCEMRFEKILPISEALIQFILTIFKSFKQLFEDNQFNNIVFPVPIVFFRVNRCRNNNGRQKIIISKPLAP